MPNEYSGVPIVDSGAGDVFADEAVDYDLINGTVRIRFAVSRSIEPCNPSDRMLVHVGRLVLPIQSAQRLALSLYDFLSAHGLDPKELLVGEQKAN